MRPGNYYPGWNSPKIELNNANILNVLDPVNPQDAATKNYVDTNIKNIVLPANQLQVATVVITSAQLKALFATPITVLAASLAGTGKSILVNRALFRYNFGSIQYTGGGAMQLQYSGQSANLLGATVPASFLTTPTGAVTTDDLVPAGNTVVSAIQNTGVQIAAASANFAAGDGTLSITVWYSVI